MVEVHAKRHYRGTGLQPRSHRGNRRGGCRGSSGGGEAWNWGLVRSSSSSRACRGVHTERRENVV